MYKFETTPISKNKYYKLKKAGKIVQRTVTTVAITYKDEYEKILNSKADNNEKALNKLYNDFYDIADEYIKELDQYKCFLSEDYLNRVEINLKPTMEHYITKILNKKIA